MKKPKLRIQTYFHCQKCLEELPEGESPQSYSRYDVGAVYTPDPGVQVWCRRHDIEVVFVNLLDVNEPE